MQISKPKVWLVITLLLGVLTTFLVMKYLQSVRSSHSMTSIIVAAKQIPEGTRLTTELLKSKTIPQEYLPEGAYEKTDQIANQFSAVTLYPDQPIVKGQVVQENVAKELSYKVPEGKRAISISINAVSGVAGLIKPGNFVDLLLSYEKASTDSELKQNSVTVLQNIQVLAVGGEMQKKEGVQAAENITLAVSPQDAELVTLSENLGKLKLTLRSNADNKEISLPRFDYKKIESMFP